METLKNITVPEIPTDEQEITDPVETFAEQLEKIDVATYFCHNCTLEEMQKMKQKVERNKKKLQKLQKLRELQELAEQNQDDFRYEV